MSITTIVFTPSLDHTDETSELVLSSSQTSACQSFMDAQNAITPDRYPTLLSLIVSNLKTGVLTDLQSEIRYPPQSDPPVPVSGIAIGENMDTFSDNEMHAVASFVRGQNAIEAGRYDGVAHLLARNLREGLLTTLVAMFPSGPTSTALASRDAAQVAYDSALAAANELPFSGADPVEIAPYAP